MLRYLKRLYIMHEIKSNKECTIFSSHLTCALRAHINNILFFSQDMYNDNFINKWEIPFARRFFTKHNIKNLMSLNLFNVLNSRTLPKRIRYLSFKKYSSFRKIHNCVGLGLVSCDIIQKRNKLPLISIWIPILNNPNQSLTTIPIFTFSKGRKN